MARLKQGTAPLTIEQLHDYYREINRKCFGSVLPDKISIRYTASTKAAGKALVKLILDPKAPRFNKRLNAQLDWSSLAIEMGIEKERTEDRFRAMFLHEMIHIYFYVIGEYDEDHGSKFMTKRKELMAATGLDIPITDTFDPSGDTSEFHATPVGVITITRPGGRVSFAILRAQAVKDSLDEIFERMSYWKDAHVRVYITNSRPILELSIAMKTQRSYSSKTKFYYIKDAAMIISDLNDNGTLLRET